MPPHEINDYVTTDKGLKLHRQKGKLAHLQSRKTWKCKICFKLPNLFSEQNEISPSE